jgi:putative transposase
LNNYDLDISMPSKYDPRIHHRKSIRLKGYDYSQAGAYFVTIVSQNREPFFGEIRDGEMIFNDAGRMIQTVWESMSERFPQFELGAFVVMPNHFHAIVIIQGGAGLVPAPRRATTRVAPTDSAAPTSSATLTNRVAPTLGRIIGAFKSITTHEYIAGVDNLGWTQFHKRLWQRNYYEHIIRNDKEMDAIWRYIEANPASWGDDDENTGDNLITG